MSGGVGPTCNDISLPNEREQEQKLQEDLASLKNHNSSATSKKAGFLSFRQLNALAVMTVFAASGMVSPEDFAFVVFSIIYMYLFSKVAFPITNPPRDSVVFHPKNKVLRLYVFVAAIIGLFLPIAYIFEGIFEGDKEGIKAAAPHVFLLGAQVFMEGVACSDRFSIPVRVFVPVFYNSRRRPLEEPSLLSWQLKHSSPSQERTLSINLTTKAFCSSSMASFRFPLALFLSSLFLHAALAEIVCEELPNDLCAFTVSSSGKRCLLETYANQNGAVEYQCRTSEVFVDKMADYIETDACVKACGVDRNSVGISSDSLLEPQFTAKLCSPACYQNCPNIVDLYFNLAAGEGAFLPDLCEAARYNPHRSMIQLMSSGAAPGPVATETASLIAAPAPAPM